MIQKCFFFYNNSFIIINCLSSAQELDDMNKMPSSELIKLIEQMPSYQKIYSV